VKTSWGSRVLGGLLRPFGVAAPLGAEVTIKSVTGTGPRDYRRGRPTLAVLVRNTGTATTDVGVEALIVGDDEFVEDVWVSTQHPSGRLPGYRDDPMWFQFRARSVAPGQFVVATFETDFGTLHGRCLQIVVCAAPLGRRYQGPILAGKRTGAKVSRLVDVSPSDTCIRYFCCKWPEVREMLYIPKLEIYDW
jgi:hypothetical protein